MADAPRPVRFVAVTADGEREVSAAPTGDGRWTVTVDDRTHVVDARRTGPATWSLLLGEVAITVGVAQRGEEWAVETAGHTQRLRLVDERRLAAAAPAGGGEREVRASMPGKVVAVHVQPGDAVVRGQPLLVVEAMKMENDVLAPCAGTVRKLAVRVGQAVEGGALLAVVE